MRANFHYHSWNVNFVSLSFMTFRSSQTVQDEYYQKISMYWPRYLMQVIRVFHKHPTHLKRKMENSVDDFWILLAPLYQHRYSFAASLLLLTVFFLKKTFSSFQELYWSQPFDPYVIGLLHFLPVSRTQLWPLAQISKIYTLIMYIILKYTKLVHLITIL